MNRLEPQSMVVNNPMTVRNHRILLFQGGKKDRLPYFQRCRELGYTSET